MVKGKISHQLIKSVKILLSRGTPPHAIKKHISSLTKLKKTRCGEIYKEILEILNYNQVLNVAPAEESELEFNEKNSDISYNKEQDCYIMFLKKLNKNIVLKGEVYRDIVRSYSDLLGEPATISQLARTHGIPRNLLTEIIRMMGLTHSDLPYTNEEIENKDEHEIASELLELKKFKIVQEFNKKDWHLTQLNSLKWQNFVNGTLDPFNSFLRNWEPPTYKPQKFTNKIENNSNHLLVSGSDWHFGLIAQERYLYFKKGWNIENTKECVAEYSKKIKEFVNTKKIGYESAYLVLMGDAIHTLTGFTDKGTHLDAFPVGEEQLDVAFTTLILFIQELLSIFPKIYVKSVGGNHSSLGDYILSKMLESYFRTEARINFEITTKRFLTYKINNFLFLQEHGYAPQAKSRLPRHGTQRENYINGLFLSKPEELQGIKQKYYLSADQHHFEVYESKFYEAYMFSTIVGGCKHSDHNLYNSRQKQTLLGIDKNGVSEIINIHFD